MTRARLRWAAIFVALAGLAGACAEGDRQDTLDPEGPIARKLDRLWDPVFLIAVVIFFLVEGLVLWVILRYRARSDEDAPVQVHGNTKLEIGWTVLPAVLLAAVGIFTVATIVDLDRTPRGADVLTVNVTGHQWWWEYEYPEQGIVTANELHIPVNRRINVRLFADDVIHSFWVPKLAGKVDTIPGRENHLVLEAEEPGVTYFGQCTEYCGLSHANMRIRVITHSEDDFAQWVRGQVADPATPADGPAAEGHDLFKTRGCGGCHTVKGYTAGEVGPDLTHFASRRVFAGAMFSTNTNTLRRWLRDPPREKPMDPDHGMGMPNLNLTEDEITKLIAYLESLH